MKIICTQENLNHGLFVVSHITSKNVNLPILNNVLIEVDENIIKLSSTNLEIGINCIIRGRVEKKGAYTVQAKLLSEYVSLLPKEKMELTTTKDDNNEILLVKCKNYFTKIKGMPAADFPLIPPIDRKKPYICQASSLKEAISQVIFATSTSETRPEISGVLLNFESKKLTLVATDSYRLAEKSIMLDTKSNTDSQRVIIPTQTLQEVLRVIGSQKESSVVDELKTVDIFVSENQILFVMANIELTSRLIEGQYPDYQQIIPKEFKTKTQVNISSLIKATKSVALFTRSGIYDINLDLLPKPHELVVSATNSQLGENTSRLTVQVAGDQNNIILNYRYLLDGLQNINSEEVELRVIDGSNPCVVKPNDKSDYLYIIMPIKQ